MGIVQSQVECVTPALASEYLRHNKNNRPLNARHVDFLARQMKEGKWELNGQTIAFDEDENLLDGQHRLTAQIKANVNVYYVVVRGVNKDSFATIDQGKMRSHSDIFYLAGVNNAATVSSIVNRYVSFHRGLSPLSNAGHGGNSKGQGKDKVSKKELLEIYNSHADVFQEAARIASRAEKNGIRIMTRVESGSLAAYLVIDLGYDEETINSFIGQLFSGKSEFKCIETLHKKLANSLISSVKMSSQLKTNLLAKVWNAFVTGKDIKTLFWKEKEGKIKFISPLNRNNHER